MGVAGLFGAHVGFDAALHITEDQIVNLFVTGTKPTEHQGCKEGNTGRRGWHYVHSC